MRRHGLPTRVVRAANATDGTRRTARSPVDGIVVVTKAIPITEQGDCVFVVGTVIDRAALL